MQTYIEPKKHIDFIALSIIGIFMLIMISILTVVVFAIHSVSANLDTIKSDYNTQIVQPTNNPVSTTEKLAPEEIINPQATTTKDPNDKNNYAKLIYVNIGEQKLYAYEYGKVVFSTPITSGKDISPTVKGKFSIQNKVENTHLRGYDTNGRYYDVAVHYWMPFFEDYGMHDTPTPTNYGGQDYHTKGSLGCVRTPLNAVEQIYNWGEIGTPVWVD